jgi:hypothetical protein
MATCKNCNLEFEPNSKKQMFCCAYCRLASHRKGKDRKVREAIQATCAVCGASYKPDRSSSRYCSDACKQSAYRKRKISAVVHVKPFVLKVGTAQKELLNNFSVYWLSDICDIEQADTGHSSLYLRNPEYLIQQAFSSILTLGFREAQPPGTMHRDEVMKIFLLELEMFLYRHGGIESITHPTEEIKLISISRAALGHIDTVKYAKYKETGERIGIYHAIDLITPRMTCPGDLSRIIAQYGNEEEDADIFVPIHTYNTLKELSGKYNVRISDLILTTEINERCTSPK